MSLEAVLAFIEHHGVKGQKWGVRRKHSSLSRSRGPSTTAHLSNDELRKVVERMRLDQDFHKLSSAKTHKGRAYAAKLLKDIGTASVASAGAMVTTKVLKKAFG